MCKVACSYLMTETLRKGLHGGTSITYRGAGPSTLPVHAGR